MWEIWQSPRQLSCTSQGTLKKTNRNNMFGDWWCWAVSSYVGNLKGTSRPMHSQNPSMHFWNSWDVTINKLTFFFFFFFGGHTVNILETFQLLKYPPNRKFTCPGLYMRHLASPQKMFFTSVAIVCINILYIYIYILYILSIYCQPHFHEIFGERELDDTGFFSSFM